MRIAVVGSGVSGLIAARELARKHEVTVFESDGRIGGHAHTYRVDLADETHYVDTGFVVYNERNYPNFSAVLRELGVSTQPSEMSLSVTDQRSGLEYRTTTLNSLFSQRSNVVNPKFARMLIDIWRFNRDGQRYLKDPDDDLTLREFLRAGGYSKTFVDDYLVPLGAAVWSANPQSYDDFPMVSLASFLDNHGLLSFGHQPKWRTITGGSRNYVQALVQSVDVTVRPDSPVSKIERTADDVAIWTDQGGVERFDHVVIAAHSDQALGLLSDPTTAELEILGSIEYQPNEVALHTDTALMPTRRRAWASWNYTVPRHASNRATLTYWMNNLQGINSSSDLLVSLNRTREINPDKLIRTFDYSHPVYNLETLKAQRRRDEIQGTRRTWFCGAYWYWGFHEDGVRSGLDVAKELSARS